MEILCKKCGQTGESYGGRLECKLCTKARTSAYKKANPEKAKEYVANSAEKNRIRAREWRIANPERALESQRAKRAKNPEIYRQHLRDWQARNRDKYLKQRIDISGRRRAKERNSETGRVDYWAVLDKYGFICHICELPIEADMHFDHIIPIAAGGPHITENIAPSHPRCNQRKGARLV